MLRFDIFYPNVYEILLQRITECGHLWVNSMTTQEEKLQQVADIMDRVSEDMSVPRNIRRAAKNAKDSLLEEDEDSIVKAASAISILDEISNDPNMPVHTRTTIWSALSILETVKE